MPRPKGSKNKKTADAIVVNEEVAGKIAAVETEIADLGNQLKAKKNELKALMKEKAKADKAAAARKAEEDKARLLDAVAASGKSIEEVLELLK